MGIKDFIITPFYICMLSIVAYMIRPYVTTKRTRKYFLPALWVKFIGAIALGLIYQFYYHGGDTFNYFTHGSELIWEAFNYSPSTALRILLDPGGTYSYVDTYPYIERIWYYRDSHSFFIVRITALFDLLTLHTYTATALFFAFFSFSGLWAMYLVLHRIYPKSKIHIAILFVPSVIFWGSGILKDTITLGALGWLTWGMVNIVFRRRAYLLSLVVAVFASILILKIKPYILLCYIPIVFLTLYIQNIKKIKNFALFALKVFLTPVLLLVIGGMGVLSITYASTDEYNIDNIAYRASVTAYDIRYGWGSRTGGDGGYDIGVPDGSWQSMIRLMPAAINVSLFRPYLWEVRNPLMFLTAIESLMVLILTLRVFRKGGWKRKLKDPFLVFCLGFSLLFAFAVGVSTFNFGTLMRYKIPFMPFLGMLLVIDPELHANNLKRSLKYNPRR